MLRAAVVTLLLPSLLFADDAKRKPNVLLVMTDDQGYGDLSCHGNPVLKTPHLDKLHRESVRLTDFHVCPMCTPTRGQLMTGLDALRNGATSVTAGRAIMRPGLPTMPELFAASGYKTGIFGKWHLGDSYPHRPMDRGFQEAMYHKGWGITAAPEFNTPLFDGRYFHNGEAKPFKGFMTDFWFDSAKAWMKKCKGANEPFFCYLPTNAPHGPCDCPSKYSAPYKGKGPAPFFGMIANIDDNVGKLEVFLKEQGLRDDTIVIYVHDNGGTAGVNTFNAGMRGRKTTYYDGGHRSPCFVRWPAGKLRAPGDVTATTSNTDLLPTLIDLCGLKKPEKATFDGVSLADLLRGKADKLADRMLVVQYGQILKKWDSAVLWDRWRLVHGTELYDLAADPGQKANVIEKHPDVAKKMRSHYEQWWGKLEPVIKEYVPLTLGSPKEPSVRLTSSDWQDIYSDNAGHVRKAVGGPRGGWWNVLIDREGEYEIALRRWPHEVDTALTGSPDAKGMTMPIAAAKLSVAGMEFAAKSPGKDAREVVLRAHLPKGKTTLRAWFQDADGKDLCGAFYATVTWKGAK
jgi:arylsulfatase A-like enzyme